MSDESIYQKYIEWKTSDKSLGGYYDDLEIAFEAGYELAQKEMQEKLDEAIEVIKWYMNNSPEKGGCIDDNFAYAIRLAVPSNKRARDFLKAREE